MCERVCVSVCVCERVRVIEETKHTHTHTHTHTGPVIPLIFQDISLSQEPTEWNWVVEHISTNNQSFGIKFGGSARGHHLTESGEIANDFKADLVDSSVLAVFSGNEMDQSWTKPLFQQNLPLWMYWAAVESLHGGLSVWDVTDGCLVNSSLNDYPANNYGWVFDFFNVLEASEVVVVVVVLMLVLVIVLEYTFIIVVLLLYE